jgi:hypothetical protein
LVENLVENLKFEVGHGWLGSWGVVSLGSGAELVGLVIRSASVLSLKKNAKTRSKVMHRVQGKKKRIVIYVGEQKKAKTRFLA